MKTEKTQPTVLDVGQCGVDHAAISTLLEQQFMANVDRAHTASEALRAMETRHYDLVLINRVFDRDGSRGLDLLRAIRQRPEFEPVPVMVVSNYPETQREAVAAGAVPGFGKAALEEPETLSCLEQVLRTAESQTG